MEEPNERSVLVWCHTCNEQTAAHMNQDLGELECNQCHHTFVEEVNQGVEEFLNVGDVNVNLQSSSSAENRNESSEGNTSNSRRDSPIDHGQIIQHILGRVLGINAQFPPVAVDDDRGISVINQISGNTRRPVGIVIRHGPSFPGLGGSGGFDEGVGVPRGLFGLLNSISAIRQSNHNPDALSNAQFEQFLHHILMNESAHSGAPPASDAVIESLKKLAVAESTDLSGLGECCISQEVFEVGDIVVCLPCGHNYKEEPIVQWLKMHNTCPVCRVEINATST